MANPTSPIVDGLLGLPAPRTYLIISAHPDDADFGCAATAARLAKLGNPVHYLLCTTGEEGGEDPEQSDAELIAIREREQRAAGEILGLAGVHFLGYPDGGLVPSLDVRKALVRVMRQVKADVVICQDPRFLVDDDGHYLNHPDHRAAGQAAVDAAFPGPGNPRAYRDMLAEGLPPHKVREVWLYFTDAAHVNHWVDVADTLDTKIAALAAHTSQIGEWASSGGLKTEMTRWAHEAAQRRGLPFAAAEGFQRIVLEREEEQAAAAEAAAAEETASG